MPYVYPHVESLQHKSKVGSGECVALVQYYAHVPKHTRWHEGARVRGNLAIQKGTAIATFVRGEYPNHDHGNHAAFYLSQDACGIWVMEQWKNRATILRRHIKFKGQHGGGILSDNGDAFSVIE